MLVSPAAAVAAVELHLVVLVVVELQQSVVAIRRVVVASRLAAAHRAVAAADVADYAREGHWL